MTSIDDNLFRKLKEEIEDVLPRVRDLRHSIHSEPELALQEHKTREKIASVLSGTSLRVRDPLLGTDLIADLLGKESRTILLRCAGSRSQTMSKG